MSYVHGSTTTTSTTFPPLEDIVLRFEELGESVISRQINWLELLPCLLEQDLVDHEDQGFFLDDTLAASDGCHRKLMRLGERLRERGGKAHTKFLQRVRSSKHHLGHTYVAAILEGRAFASEEDIRTSQLLKDRIRANMTHMSDINLDESVPLLFSIKLVTRGEAEKLLNKNESTKNMQDRTSL